MQLREYLGEGAIARHGPDSTGGGAPEVEAGCHGDGGTESVKEYGGADISRAVIQDLGVGAHEANGRSEDFGDIADTEEESDNKGPGRDSAYCGL